MSNIFTTIVRAAKSIPEAYRNVPKDATHFIAAGLALNILWGAYMFVVEGFIVGFTLSAIISLRASAVIWNFIFAPYAQTMEAALIAAWQKPIRWSTSPLTAPFRAIRWYAVAIGISLISQVPIQIAAYPMAIYVFGHATWGGLLPLTAAEWQSFGAFMSNSWFPIAILFSPILGPIFTPITNWITRHLKIGARKASRLGDMVTRVVQ